MTDTQNGNIQVEEKLPPAIPTEIKPAEAVVDSESDGKKERTPEQQAKIDAYNKAEFDKVLAKKEAAELELAAYKNKNSVLDDLRPPKEVQVETPNLTPEKVEEIKSKFIDENGYVDVGKVEEALNRAEERAKRAEEKANKIEAKIQDSEEQNQVKATHAEFPQLDPHSDKFDPKFFELVRNDLIGQMMQGEQDLMKAARKVSQLYTPVNVQTAKTEAVEEYKAKVTKRDQASDEVSSRGKGEPSDLEELKRKTQAGDQDALYKRLQASGN